MSFSSKYPYLAYWIENHGYIQLGIDDDSPSDALLTIIDAGGVCWEDEDSSTIEEALSQAEDYLRTTEFPDRFGKKVIEEIEASAKKKKGK
ncbi:MAG: hypothetical protein V4714_18285 [Bacteroidota bacterium]